MPHAAPRDWNMKKQRKSTSESRRYQKHHLKIEEEQFALVLALREAQEQLKQIGQHCEGVEFDPVVEEEKEALATKCNYFRRRLKSVRESLSRLRSGRFGICDSCGEAISEKRLIALPTASFCLECQQSYEHECAEAVLLRA